MVQYGNIVPAVQYGKIFPEVRQRVAAFKYWKEFCEGSAMELPTYGVSDEDDYLDEAYRFLYTSASKDFIEFCASKEGMDLNEYCSCMEIDIDGLL